MRTHAAVGTGCVSREGAVFLPTVQARELASVAVRIIRQLITYWEKKKVFEILNTFT